MSRAYVFFLGFVLVSPALADTITYAQECERKIGVPVPAFSCTDPQATVLRATNNGVPIPEGSRDTKCDTPAHGESDCYTGTRILKFTDTIERVPGQREKIETIVMCRRKQGDAGNVFRDMGVIQLNKTKNLSCWFSQQSNKDSSRVPSPSSPQAKKYWGAKQPNMNCLGCHDGSTWIRSPAFAQITGTTGGYTRGPGEREYIKGGGNQVPNDDQRVGPSCPVGTPEEFPATLPRQLKVNLAAYEKKFGRTDPTKASPTTCFECHYIGTGGMGCGMARDAFNGGGRLSKFSDWAKRGVNRRWMPPQFAKPYWPRNMWNMQERREALASMVLNPQALALAAAADTITDPVYERQTREFLEPARVALEYCCTNPGDRAICGGRFIQTPANACWALAAPAAPAAGGAAGSKTHSTTLR